MVTKMKKRIIMIKVSAKDVNNKAFICLLIVMGTGRACGQRKFEISE